MTKVLKNARFIITQDSNRRILQNKDVLIEKGKIVQIGKGLKGEEEIDCSNQLLMPGLINLHTHSSMSLFRGIGDDMLLQDWLENRIFPLESKLTEKDVYWGAKLAGLEMLESGTTTFIDMYYHMNQVARVCEELGIRGYLGPAVVDFPSPDSENPEESLGRTKKLVKMKGEFVQPTVQPHSIYLCSKQTLLKCKRVSEEHDLLIHMHLSETMKEVQDCEKEHGLKPVEYLEDIGLLKKKTVFAHGIWLSDDELRLLKKSGSSIAHNPTSNMKLASGTSPLNQILQAGVNAGLGTDSAASNNNLDMFEEMKFASLLQKNTNSDPTLVAAQEILDMATINGAKALGRTDLGCVEPGNTADIIGLDLSSPRLRPFTNLLSHVVYSASGADVNLVLTKGDVRVDGKMRGREVIIEKAEECAQNLMERAGLEI